MSIRTTWETLSGRRPVAPEIKQAVADARARIPGHVRTLHYSRVSIICQALEQTLEPGEEIRFIGTGGKGAFAVTDRRVLATSVAGMEKQSLPIDSSLSVYIDHDLTETNLRFTGDGGREIQLSDVLLMPQQEASLRDALPPGVMF